MLYTGGCHCGKVRFEIDMAIDKAVACNCSMCSKKGHLLAFAPKEKFKLLSGEDSLTDYQFGKKTIHHLFCKYCGVSSFGTGATPDEIKMAAVNLRCLDNVDINQFPILQ
ncbi:MAG TPA: aldehyde-activating protein, partial [Deltaproteobacteria bacterium]|nr:aldehyde-activating protein [Deltaproteobacteria bacterium]